MGGRALTLLLDTHILLWWLSTPDRLSAGQARAIGEARERGERLALASISLWETVRLADRGRISYDQPADALLDLIDQHPEVAVLPLDRHVALDSHRLGDRMSKDPADQLIVATARVHGLRLVTADDQIRRAGVVTVI